jgi:glycosyltransferase involved in cell wall biosynthesis
MGSALNRRFRVLHVIDSLDLGGAQSVLINLVRYADRSLFDLEVATMSGRGVYWDRVQALGVPMHSLSFARFVPVYVPSIILMCIKRRYDIVHTHLIGANVIAKPLAALCGVKIRINHDHCNDKASDPKSWVPIADKISNRLSTHVIAVSQSTRDYLVEHERMAPDRVTTIHNGIDLDVFHPRPGERAAARQQLGLPADAFIVAGIGRLSYQKNFSLFIDVAAAVLAQRPNAYFVIAGTGPEDQQLRERAARLGIDHRLRFLGYVSDMPNFYPAADVLLLTSRYEGLPITILEAMATGTTIVSSKLDGVAEIMRDGEDGALVAASDVDGFVRQLCELMDRPDIAARRAAAALNKVQTGFSAQSVARSVEEVYLKCLGANAVPQRA